MSGGHKNYRSMSQEGDHGGMGSQENVVTEIPPSRRRLISSLSYIPILKRVPIVESFLILYQVPHEMDPFV